MRVAESVDATNGRPRASGAAGLGHAFGRRWRLLRRCFDRIADAPRSALDLRRWHSSVSRNLHPSRPNPIPRLLAAVWAPCRIRRCRDYRRLRHRPDRVETWWLGCRRDHSPGWVRAYRGPNPRHPRGDDCRCRCRNHRSVGGARPLAVGSWLWHSYWAAILAARRSTNRDFLVEVILGFRRPDQARPWRLRPPSL